MAVGRCLHEIAEALRLNRMDYFVFPKDFECKKRLKNGLKNKR
jgi:hypothetical protein